MNIVLTTEYGLVNIVLTMDYGVNIVLTTDYGVNIVLTADYGVNIVLTTDYGVLELLHFKLHKYITGVFRNLSRGAYIFFFPGGA